MLAPHPSAPPDAAVAPEPGPPAPLAEPCCPGVERWLLLGCLVLAVVLRVLYAYHFRIDSDEPQHLHVVWGWTQGKLPYRDFFDNHMPLFQAMYAPIFAWLGERADIISPMRVALLPIYLGTVWVVASIGRHLVSARAGWWAAAAAALYPPFFQVSSEFRPDDAWALLWLAALLVLVSGPFTWKRAFGAGLILGLTFCISMKTSLMLASIAIAALITLLLKHEPGAKWREILPALPAMAAGIVIPPALVVLYFVAHGAGESFKQCIILHNLAVGRTQPATIIKETRRWGIYLFFSIIVAWALYRVMPVRSHARRAFFLALAVLNYNSLLHCFWPILTLEDYLPYWPGMFAAFAPVAAWYAFKYAPLWRLPAALGPVFFIAAEVGFLIWQYPRDDKQYRDVVAIVATALRVTDPSQLVLDAKGECIYRNRPIYPVLEGVTNRGIKHGRIPNDFIARLIETRTPLATWRRMPADVRQFVDANYLGIAFRLAVLGKGVYLPPPFGKSPVPRPEQLEFDLAIGERYRMISDAGPQLLTGTLNGEPFNGEATLAPGHYTFVSKGGAGRIVLVWAQALERGYSPLAKITQDYNTDQD